VFSVGGRIYPFCASFAQVSFSVMVRFKTSLPGVLSLSGANEAHMAFFSQDKRQAKPGILRAQLPRHAAERTFGTGDERRSFTRFVFFVFHNAFDCHANTSRPRGSGISKPLSFAVLIQNLMASSAFLMAVCRVAPCAMQPDNTGTSTT